MALEETLPMALSFKGTLAVAQTRTTRTSCGISSVPRREVTLSLRFRRPWGNTLVVSRIVCTISLHRAEGDVAEAMYYLDRQMINSLVSRCGRVKHYRRVGLNHRQVLGWKCGEVCLDEMCRIAFSCAHIHTCPWSRWNPWGSSWRDKTSQNNTGYEKSPKCITRSWAVATKCDGSWHHQCLSEGLRLVPCRGRVSPWGHE